MTEPQDLMKWINRGCQRRSVALSLQGIRTGTQLWRAASAHAPRITLRDTRAILRQFEARQLVICLNPSAPCGRLFRVTPQGRDLLYRAFQMPQPADAEVPADLLSFVLRAPVRRAVLLAIAHPPLGKPPTRTASTIKRRLRETCPLTLNQTIRALHELARSQLIECVDRNAFRRIYRLTAAGEAIATTIQNSGLVKGERDTLQR